MEMTLIDHHTLKAHGLDREPTIHLGAETWRWSKKGARTERDNYNQSSTSQWITHHQKRGKTARSTKKRATYGRKA